MRGRASELPFKVCTNVFYRQHPYSGSSSCLIGKIQNLKPSSPPAIFLRGAVHFKIVSERSSKSHISTAQFQNTIG